MNTLTKSANFIPVESTYSADGYSRIFKYEIVCLHGIPLSIILDRGAQFTSRIRRSFKKGLGNNLNLSSSFHL